jgi:hypothetical protein
MIDHKLFDFLIFNERKKLLFYTNLATDKKYTTKEIEDLEADHRI